MGPGIALTLAIGGLETVIVSRTAEAAAAGRRKALDQLAVLSANGLVEPGDVLAIEGRISSSEDFEASVAPVDVVVEAGPETMDYKRAVYRRLEAVVRPRYASTVAAASSAHAWYAFGCALRSTCCARSFGEMLGRAR